jgi:hypothetical protein
MTSSATASLPESSTTPVFLPAAAAGQQVIILLENDTIRHSGADYHNFLIRKSHSIKISGLLNRNFSDLTCQRLSQASISSQASRQPTNFCTLLTNQTLHLPVISQDPQGPSIENRKRKSRSKNTICNVCVHNIVQNTYLSTPVSSPIQTSNALSFTSTSSRNIPCPNHPGPHVFKFPEA